MTARTVSLTVSLACAAAVAACTGFYEIPIETPIQAKLDVSPFQRVLVAGFVAGGTDDVDANQETVRLLRSQLRTKSSLKVIEADTLPLMALVDRPAQNSSSGLGLQPVPLPSRKTLVSRTRRTSSRTSGSSPTSATGRRSARSISNRSS